MLKNKNIPVASDLIALGNPKLKAQAQKEHAMPSYLDELNNRIDELESAIGQDNAGPIGRASAIRAEENAEPSTELNNEENIDTTTSSTSS